MTSTSRGQRSKATIVLTIAALGAVLLGFVTWAMASPVGGAPDEDYHLGSIWCPRPIEGSGCQFTVEDGVISTVTVPETVAESQACLAHQPEVNASCSDHLSDGRAIESDRFDDGGYPWGYYQFQSLFVGESVHQSVVVMRIANILIGLGALLGVALLAPAHTRHHLLIASIVAWIPMGVYFIASVNPSSWAITGCLIYGASLIAALEAVDWRWWALLGTGLIGAVMAATSRTDSAFYLFIIALAVLLLSRLTKAELPIVAFAGLVALVGLVIFSSTGQAGNMTGSGGWQTHQDISLAAVFVANLLTIPEYIGEIWGLGGGPGWYDIPLMGWTTIAMLFVVGGVVFVGATEMSWRKSLSSLVLVGAIAGIPVVSLTLRSIYPTQTYQGRYMLPLVAVFFLVWLTRDNQRFSMASTAQIALIASAASIANMFALQRTIRRYTIGMRPDEPLAGLLGFKNVEWWPWSIDPWLLWVAGSIAMAAGLTTLLILTVRSAGKSLDDLPVHVATETEMTSG